MVRTDRFGNPLDPELSYATGEILAEAEDQYDEVVRAREFIRNRWEADGPEAIFNFSGLERGIPTEPGDLESVDDETAPALYEDRLRELTLDHFGGSPDDHDVFLANRMTAATISTFKTLVDPGQTVVGVAPNNSHASVIRAADEVGARFVDTDSFESFAAEFDAADDVGLVALSRMDVTYELLDLDEVTAVIDHAHANDVLVYMDDAGGARVAPALFDHPRSLELDVDVLSTGLDKYGTYGPRFGLMGGDADLIRRIRSTAWKFGMEARPTFVVGAMRSLERYDPQRVRDCYETTVTVGEALTERLGDVVGETPTIVKLTGEDILDVSMERAGIEDPPLVPIEATGALSMLMLRDYGVVTVHFVGIPSGTPDFLLKFMPPEEVERFGGPAAFADAVDESLDALADLLTEPAALRTLLLG